MIKFEHELRAPGNVEEWSVFHNIRRTVLFENRGKLGSYNENHPDDSEPGNHPLILLNGGVVIGVVRVDVYESVAWLRRVAIREDLQRRGHGRILLQLAEAFADAEGCSEVRTNAAMDAVGFYENCGYERDATKATVVNSVAMYKLLG